MNRRSFISGILAAMVAPSVLVPKAADHARWRVTQRRGLYVAETRMLELPFNAGDFAGKWMFIMDSLQPGTFGMEAPVSDTELLDELLANADFA